MTAARPCAALVLAAACLAAPAAQAADVEFLPVFELTVRHDDNVAVTGEENISDQVVQLTMHLDLTARTRRTLFDLSLRPYREVYLDFGDLDNTGLSLTSLLRHEISRRSSFRMTLSGARTEQQSPNLDPSTGPTTLVPRTRIDRFNLALGGRIGSGRRSFDNSDSKAYLKGGSR